MYNCLWLLTYNIKYFPCMFLKSNGHCPMIQIVYINLTEAINIFVYLFRIIYGA